MKGPEGLSKKRELEQCMRSQQYGIYGWKFKVGPCISGLAFDPFGYLVNNECI